MAMIEMDDLISSGNSLEYLIEYETRKGWVRQHPPIKDVDGALKSALFAQTANRLCKHRIVRRAVKVEETAVFYLPALGPVPFDTPVHSMRVDESGETIYETTHFDKEGREVSTERTT
jgi:hypothetical protein